MECWLRLIFRALANKDTYIGFASAKLGDANAKVITPTAKEARISPSILLDGTPSVAIYSGGTVWILKNLADKEAKICSFNSS